MIIDERFMQRCLHLAEKGRSTVAPNPMVGCVIVHQNKIIGEGWHQKAGQPHAEVNAIANVKNKALLKDSTVYVSLEPCNHYGRTPPCAHLLVAQGVKRVVVGCQDPFEKVNGSGIETLRQAGIEVVIGVLEKACQRQNERFFIFHQQKRPYILLKWAQTANNMIAPLPEDKASQRPFYIAQQSDLRRVHQWRSEEAAIAVGAQTAMDDDPALTTRWVHGNNPVRVLLDPHDRVGKEHRIFNGEAKTLHYTHLTLGLSPNPSPKEYLSAVLKDLYTKEITSLLVEGGRFTLQQLIDGNLWDEARIYIGEKTISEGIEAPQFPAMRQGKRHQGWQHR